MNTKEPFYWANTDTRDFMSRGYLTEGESVESRCHDISQKMVDAYGVGVGERFYNYLASGYYSLSSPVWSNFGRDRGLPISCNNSNIEDSVESILYKTAEIGMMTKHGAGTSAYLGQLRPRGTPILS